MRGARHIALEAGSRGSTLLIICQRYHDAVTAVHRRARASCHGCGFWRGAAPCCLVSEACGRECRQFRMVRPGGEQSPCGHQWRIDLAA